ncbi:UNVERIFIED_CONTAM: hypothetical protein PYX00_000176 [Menopon gallinae]|uniref:Unconventional prefoldin RPB5 interactor n=1 Tax=Menopon gallinae TaxID=328185 RepID=A0AAW2I9G8_9NEOP
MTVNPGNLDSWFQSLADEALDRNDRSVITWTKYRDDLEGTKEILSWLPKKLKHDVMVPIGPKALMRGKIVHTNELLVNLGETWFVKKTASQTVDLCNRRIKECDSMLEKLKKERELLESKKSLPAEKEAFGSDERPEIIECVTEEEHEEWKKEHRIRVRGYRQKLAELRNKEKKPIETEEDLWNRLDELELREELEDELARLNSENYPDDNGDDDDNDSNEDLDLCESVEQSCDVNTKAEPKAKNHRVSFSIDKSDDESSDDMPNVLEIIHSPNEPEFKPFTGDINSPEDIYQSYLKTLNPKSILKNSVNVNHEIEQLNCLAGDDSETESDKNEDVDYHVNSGIVLSDVVAKNMDESGDGMPKQAFETSFKEPTKRISKFKASRMKES